MRLPATRRPRRIQVIQTINIGLYEPFSYAGYQPGYPQQGGYPPQQAMPQQGQPAPMPQQQGQPNMTYGQPAPNGFYELNDVDDSDLPF